MIIIYEQSKLYSPDKEVYNHINNFTKLIKYDTSDTSIKIVLIFNNPIKIGLKNK
jgi:hypothetical protein